MLGALFFGLGPSPNCSHTMGLNQHEKNFVVKRLYSNIRLHAGTQNTFAFVKKLSSSSCLPLISQGTYIAVGADDTTQHHRL